jgi:hypothetical protein
MRLSGVFFSLSFFFDKPIFLSTDHVYFKLHQLVYRHPITGGNRSIKLKWNFFSLALQPQFGPWPISMKLQFSRSWTVDRTPWAGDQLVARPLPVYNHRKTHTRTLKHPCPGWGLEPTIPASEREKTVHALDRPATVTGKEELLPTKY